MTSIRFLLALTLAFSVSACGNALDPGPVGTGGIDGAGGTGGTGGTGGGGDDGLCVNADDAMAIDDHTNGDLSGQEAVTATGQACVLDTEAGCFQFALGAATGNQEDIDSLAECVGTCIGSAVGLSPGCQACYGDIVACGASACALDCICLASPDGCIGDALFACNVCLNANCVDDFNDCSGLDGTLPES